MAELSASCITGSLVIAITNPLDCLKQRWQVAPSGSHASLLHFARAVVASDGLVGGLWMPGIASNMIACTISVGTRLGLYPLLRDGIPKRTGAGMFASGLLGGALGYIVGAPFFSATRIMQAEVGSLTPDGTKYATGALTGSAPTVRGTNGVPMLLHLARSHGVLSLWRGSEVLVARGALMSATQLATYDATKAWLRHVGLVDGPLVHCIASLAASLTLTTAICPLDVTYTAFLAGPSLGRHYSSPLACARALVHEDGVRAMLRGWVPLWLRFLPSSVLTFLIYEQSRRIMLGEYL